jgi:tRNA1(Val) A37 N6-methylase TrmN6
MEFTDDALLNGRLRLRQPARGYRAGVDAALLAAACDAADGARVLEAGCGVGAALLAAAARRPKARFVGIERDADMLAMAQWNITNNHMAERAQARPGDVGRGFEDLAETPFDLVLANPPFFDDAAALRGPTAEKRGAWIADEGLAVWVRFMVSAARQGGAVIVIHRADRLHDLLSALSHKAGSFQIRAVQPFADAPAKRILVRAEKGGRAPLTLLPPLVLHERGGGKHTPEAEAILRGPAGLGWA